MSAGSGRGRHHNERRQNEEVEPFLVQQIPGSPVFRGRRQNSQEESFLVEDMPGSPKMRGRVPRLIPSARNSVEQPAGPSADTSTNDRGLNSTNDTMDSPMRILPTAPRASSSHSHTTRPTHPRPPENDDAPPTYESSIPPVQVGWSSEVTSTIPFPMPYSHNQDERNPGLMFTYPPSDAYPPIGLSPFAISHQSIESSRSKSPIRSTSPSLSPSPNRFRPAYTYQPRLERTPSPRPRFPVEEPDGRFVAKPINQCALKYASIIMLFMFIFFLVLLAMAIRFIAISGHSR